MQRQSLMPTPVAARKQVADMVQNPSAYFDRAWAEAEQLASQQVDKELSRRPAVEVPGLISVDAKIRYGRNGSTAFYRVKPAKDQMTLGRTTGKVEQSKLASSSLTTKRRRGAQHKKASSLTGLTSALARMITGVR